jgi:glycosyltransferase involved in cell wall biosynthesis
LSSSNPLVSIIIPTFNRAHLIAETLNSVLAQSYENWECIVVDDGSTDTTDQLMAQYLAKDSRFQYHQRPTDRLPGGNAARNYGFEMCKGEFINFLDSDDLFHKETLSTKVNLVNLYKSDVIITTHTSDLKDLYTHKDTPPKVFKNYAFDIDFILSRNSIMTSDPMIKREFIENIKWDEKLRRFQEHVFFIHLFRQKMDICFYDIKLYYYKPAKITKASNSFRFGSSLINTRITLHKELNLYYANENRVLREYNKKIRRLYKKLVKEGYSTRILEHYNFFRNAFSLSFFEFTFYFLCNILFKKGFNRMNKKNGLKPSRKSTSTHKKVKN